MDGSLLRTIALIAYPAWAGIYLFCSALAIGNVWRKHDYAVVLLAAAFLLQSIAFSLLSLSIGAVVYLDVIMNVRFLAAMSAFLIYAFGFLRAAGFLRNWYYVSVQRSKSADNSLSGE